MLRVVALAALWLSACAHQQNLSEQEAAFFQDDRANPYSFNRAVAQTLLRTNQPLEASRVIHRLLEMKPESVEAHCMLGRAYLDMKQFDLAERALKTALRFDPKCAEAHALLGVLLDTLGRHGEAQLRHRLSIREAPKNPSFRNNLGFSLYLEGSYERAIFAYKAALARDMADHRVHNNLAFAYAKLGRIDKAQEHFKLAGPPAQVSNNLGFVYEDMGDDQHAYEYYHLAVRQNPLLVPARANLDRVCQRMGVPVPEVDLPKTFANEPLPPAEAAVSQAKVPDTSEGAP
ncbi:MAG: tetratricopeptide repeat protein [Myxococcales bacterium]